MPTSRNASILALHRSPDPTLKVFPGVEIQLPIFEDLLKSSTVESLLTSRFRADLSAHDLHSIAMITAVRSGLSVSEVPTSDRISLLGWFSANAAKVTTILPYIHFRDEQKKIILRVSGALASQ
jgi:hypothetical protein